PRRRPRPGERHPPVPEGRPRTQPVRPQSLDDALQRRPRTDGERRPARVDEIDDARSDTRTDLDERVEIGALMNVTEERLPPVGPPAELRRSGQVVREREVRERRTERQRALELVPADVLPDQR